MALPARLLAAGTGTTCGVSFRARCVLPGHLRHACFSLCSLPVGHAGWCACILREANPWAEPLRRVGTASLADEDPDAASSWPWPRSPRSRRCSRDGAWGSRPSSWRSMWPRTCSCEFASRPMWRRRSCAGRQALRQSRRRSKLRLPTLGPITRPWISQEGANAQRRMFSWPPRRATLFEASGRPPLRLFHRRRSPCPVEHAGPFRGGPLGDPAPAVDALSSALHGHILQGRGVPLCRAMFFEGAPGAPACHGGHPINSGRGPVGVQSLMQLREGCRTCGAALQRGRRRVASWCLRACGQLRWRSQVRGGWREASGSASPLSAAFASTRNLSGSVDSRPLPRGILLAPGEERVRQCSRVEGEALCSLCPCLAMRLCLESSRFCRRRRRRP